jgi:DNA polymerase (family 10)
VGEVPGLLDKFGIAAALEEIATLQELKGGENRFKARAYRAGARAISGYSGDIGEVIDQEQLTSIRGIGNALASQIKQLHRTGSSSVLEALRKEFPPGVIELSAVPGLTLTKIRKIHDTLGISSVAELQSAAEAGLVKTVPGFGAKTEQALLDAIRDHKKRARSSRRLHLHHADRVAESILDYLKTTPGVDQVSTAGSLRRREETVGVISITAASNNPDDLLKHFLKFPLIVRTELKDETQSTVGLLDGSRVSLTVVRDDQFPTALLVTTGAEPHVEKLKFVASHKGFNIDPERFEFTTKKRAKVRPRSEPDIYRKLGMQFVPPELREDKGEVEAALTGALPEDLLAVDDIQGMVHCHTTYSDGVNSIFEMAQAADRLGMKYLTITDHSPTASYAGGVTVDRLFRQWDEIDEVQQSVKVTLLKGTESDILADGSLDYPDDILEKFDVIVASVHARYKMDSQKMTKRLLNAMRQPVFKIWGHALGRLIERRPPFECDVERVLDAVAESRAAVEINGDPYRLDLEPKWIREARKRKIKFVISVDAHSTGALNNLKYGVDMARRGWVRRGEVLNAMELKGFKKAVKPV